MELRLPTFMQALASSEIAPIYWIAGDEPQQRRDAVDALRLQLRSRGYSERVRLSAGPRFDWHEFTLLVASPSLFGEARLIELDLANAKPGKLGGEALVAYAQKVPPDAVLLITSERLERRSKQTVWAKAVISAGVLVEVWPLNMEQTKRWIAQRVQQRGLTIRGAALDLLAQRSVGNLPAAAQEIEKLSLLYPSEMIDADQLLAAVADSARYRLQDLSTAVLAPRLQEITKVLRGLRDASVELPLLLWLVRRDLQALLAAANGTTIDTSLRPQEVSRYQVAARRRHHTQWLILLSYCRHLDAVSKGAAAGKPWDMLLDLLVAMAGVDDNSLMQRVKGVCSNLG